MIISLLVAVAKNRVMGRDNALPWHLPADLRYFKRMTMGKPMIMGRRTFEAIGKPLPGRANIIITHEPNYRAAGCTVVHSIEEALVAAKGCEEAMIIGGAKIFEQIMPRTDRIYLTEIHQDFEGDTYFPELDHSVWRETERSDCAPDAQNLYAYSFVVLDKTK